MYNSLFEYVDDETENRLNYAIACDKTFKCTRLKNCMERLNTWEMQRGWLTRGGHHNSLTHPQQTGWNYVLYVIVNNDVRQRLQPANQ